MQDGGGEKPEGDRDRPEANTRGNRVGGETLDPCSALPIAGKPLTGERAAGIHTFRSGTISDPVVLGPSQISHVIRNDLEAAALRVAPELARTRALLESLGVETLVFCGSGASYFAPVSSEEEGRELLARLQREDSVYATYVSSTFNA